MATIRQQLWGRSPRFQRNGPSRPVAKHGAITSLLVPKRSFLAGLVKFLAVGCGLNEMAPSANSSGT